MSLDFDEIMHLLEEGDAYPSRLSLLDELGQLALKDKEAENKLYEFAAVETGTQECKIIAKYLAELSKKSLTAAIILGEEKFSLYMDRLRKTLL